MASERPVVQASLTAEFPSYVSVQDILDSWSLAEVRELLDGDDVAVEELALQAHAKCEPDHIEADVSRSQLEAYVAAREHDES